VEEFAYELPEDRIAQVPVEPRDAARMLVDRGPLAPPEHRGVRDLPALLDPGDVLVVNDTRVLPARIHAAKPTGGAVEVLLLEREPTGSWRALVRPSRRVAPGTVVTAGPLTIEVGADLGDGVRRVRLGDEAPLDAVGEVPLPPYIHAELDDPERYQTVYARTPGSVAAPTAGLHLTERVLGGCHERGVRIERVDLQVGLGTFRPISTDVVEDHAMHAEAYRVEPTVVDVCRRARDHGRRVVAVGTTTLRALEAVEATGRTEGRTDIYLHGDVRPTLVDTLLTNFHVPRSSLLVLVDALVGPRWRPLYEVALADGYRFLSFGDCCLLDGRPGRSEVSVSAQPTPSGWRVGSEDG
jgi:S-adenosylmethionine:tRNA ribosyltransferase-isomerase